MRFNKELDENRMAYEGKIYRAVAENIRGAFLPLDYGRFVFIGFQALTPAEKTLFQHLMERDKAEFYWDYDYYYLDNHEAGRFIRNNVKEFPGEDLGIYQAFKEQKNIRFINTPYDIAQAKILPQLIIPDHAETHENPNHTAVVLPEEHMLLPVLKWVL
jgi:hypothetical protein